MQELENVVRVLAIPLAKAVPIILPSSINWYIPFYSFAILFNRLLSHILENPKQFILHFKSPFSFLNFFRFSSIPLSEGYPSVKRNNCELLLVLEDYCNTYNPYFKPAHT